MVYSACVPAIFSGMNPNDALENVRAADMSYYEFWGWDGEQIEQYKKAQEKYGLTPITFCTTFHDLTDPMKREEYVEGIKKTIPACKTLGCKSIITQVGPELSHLSREEQHASIVAGLKAAAPLVEEAGITLLFEPLNTRIDHPGYYLWQMEEAFRIADEVNSANVKILCDLYHQEVMDDLDIDAIVKNIDKIGHFHMAGHPGRHEPLEGVTDYKKVLGAIRESGYTGAVGLEYMPVRPAAEGLSELYHTLVKY